MNTEDYAKPSCRRWRPTRRRRWRSSGSPRRTDERDASSRRGTASTGRIGEAACVVASSWAWRERRWSRACPRRPRRRRPSWPERPVKLILPYAPGGATDLIGRPWADKLSQAFGQQFVIENRGGASGIIGTEAAAKAAPDGYTFLLTPNAPLSVQPTLRKTPYDPVKNFTPVGRVGDLISGFVIHPAVGVKTFKEMVDYAKANPGKLAYGSAGLGTSSHLRLEMLKVKAGIDILHVPYRGNADALNDLLANNVQMMNEINPMPHVQGRQADPARHQLSGAPPGLPRRADAVGGGLRRCLRAELVLDLGARRHAAGDRRQAQRQDGRDRQDARDEGAAAGDQRCMPACRRPRR